jgi:hypothetical protein
MSVSTEVQRTLVKSPPELWAELSNPEALARHLADLGEIRITSVEPETKVEWEAESASGFVQLKQSSWGTKVTLSVTRLAPVEEGSSEPEPETDGEAPPIADSEPLAVVEPFAVEPFAVESIEPEPVAVEPECEPLTAEPPEPKPESVAVKPEAVAPIEPDLDSSPAEPEPQLGFFARLLRKRKAKKVAVVDCEPAVVEPERSVTAGRDREPEVVALAAPDPVYPDPPAQPAASEPGEDLATELESLEDQMAAETTDLLTGVLDRLGAAHHRPFSRG